MRNSVQSTRGVQFELRSILRPYNTGALMLYIV